MASADLFPRTMPLPERISPEVHFDEARFERELWQAVEPAARFGGSVYVEPVDRRAPARGVTIGAGIMLVVVALTILVWALVTAFEVEARELLRSQETLLGPSIRIASQEQGR